MITTGPSSRDTIPSRLRIITLERCACGRELITPQQVARATCEHCQIAHMDTCLCGARLESPMERRMQMCLSCARRRMRDA